MADSPANRLRVRRAELRISQDQLARNLTTATDRYWSQNRVHRIENGIQVPTDAERAELARALDTTVEALFPAPAAAAEAAR